MNPEFSKQKWKAQLSIKNRIIRGERPKENILTGIMANANRARYAYNKALKRT